MDTINPYTVSNNDFAHHVDVVCPRCRKKAYVIGGNLHLPPANYEARVRFVCLACGYVVKYTDTPAVSLVQINDSTFTQQGRLLHLNAPIDPFFGFPLWYRVEATDGLLWAYNLEHLSVIENYIADPLRKRASQVMQNNSLGSRLPAWVASAKNRDYLLRLVNRARKV